VSARRLRREQRALVEALAEVVADVATGPGRIGAEALAHRVADAIEGENIKFDRSAFLAASLPRVWRGGRWHIVDRRQAVS
jgi:hypothetical protein